MAARAVPDRPLNGTAVKHVTMVVLLGEIPHLLRLKRPNEGFFGVVGGRETTDRTDRGTLSLLSVVSVVCRRAWRR